MDHKRYNEERLTRKKNMYRCKLGFLQCFNYPVLNLIWVIVAIGGALLFQYRSFLLSSFTLSVPFKNMFDMSINFGISILLFFLILFILQNIGELSARKDESFIKSALRKDNLHDSYAILSYKMNNRKTRTVLRVFYTNVPKKYWIENQDSILDLLNVHLVKEIDYYKSNGNFIALETIKGRIPKEAGVLYDEQF